ncbi:MAG: hypothetical protein NKF70_01835 [Methanobacterium sp. ERen5]|nr:MAG: hypothetical protein NKF70_01835 [Methanobacterium sp. ERen5]
MDEKILKPYKKYFVMIVILFGLSLTISLNVNCVSASQAGIYVTPNGHDSWNGQSPVWNGKSGPKKTIKNAVGTVSSGGTVFIASGTYYEHGIIISKSMKLTGKSSKNTVVNGQNSGSIFTIKSGFTVKISNLRMSNGRGSTVGALHNSGQTTLTSTSFTGNIAKNSGGAIYNKYGSLSIINSSFKSNGATSGFGGAIYNQASLVIMNTNFTSNKAVTGGGAIFNVGKLSISSCNFNYNHVTGGGAALRNFRGTVQINSSKFTGNTVKGGGGALFNENGGSTKTSLSTMLVKNCIFNSNKANSGGAIDNNYGKLTVSSCNFTNNYASSKGGALVNYHGSLTLTGCTGKSNGAYNLGGFLYNADNLLQIVKSNFLNNHVLKGSGGVIYNYHAPITISYTNFKYNTARGGKDCGYGGAIHSYMAQITANNCLFLENSASTGGGAIVNDEGSSLTVKNSNFSNNSAIGSGDGLYGNGGGIFSFNARCWVSNSNFTGNSAKVGTRGGGAIDILGTGYVSHSIASVDHCVFNNNQASMGGAIHVETGSLTIKYSTFTTNTAQNGGAIYNIHGALTATQNNINYNTAINNGAAIFNSGHNISVTHNNIIENTGPNEIYSPNNSYASNKAVVDARYNWWGSNSDPSKNVSNPGNSVLVSPWLSKPL